MVSEADCSPCCVIKLCSNGSLVPEPPWVAAIPQPVPQQRRLNWLHPSASSCLGLIQQQLRRVLCQPTPQVSTSGYIQTSGPCDLAELLRCIRCMPHDHTSEHTSWRSYESGSERVGDRPHALGAILRHPATVEVAVGEGHLRAQVPG